MLKFVRDEDHPITAYIKDGAEGGKAPKLSTNGTKLTEDVDYKVNLDGQNLTLEMGSQEDGAEVLAQAGKWLQITFYAKIKDNYKSIEALKNAGEDVWVTIEKIDSADDPNDPIDDPADVTQSFSGATKDRHEGIKNDSSYTINRKAGVDVENQWEYKDQSNTVTVQPKTTSITVNKAWVLDGDELPVNEWPQGATVEVQLVEVKGDAETPLEGKTATLTASNTSVTFDNLPVLEGVSYSVKEIAVNGAEDYSFGSVEEVSEGVFKITNTSTSPEEPEIEKYVNKDVHQELGEFDRAFTYDIMAYVPNGATKIEITDTLVDALEFATAGDGEGIAATSAAQAVAAVVIKAENNHQAGGSVTGNGVPIPVGKYSADINVKTLTVTVDNIGKGEDQIDDTGYLLC